MDSLALANVQLNLQSAFKSCFDKSRKKQNRFPKFKSYKRSRRAYTTNNQHGTVALTDNSIRLPKIGYVKAVIHRKPDSEWTLKSATISQESDGRYYASVLFEFDKPHNTYVADKTNAIGLDYASGSKKNEDKSSNYMKQLHKVNRIHRHIANQRLDNLHKLSTEIANQYDVVCVETLDMKAMSNKGFGNGKATMDNGYGMFLEMLGYKLSDRNKYLIKVDKWYPSSQICHCCGTLHPEMKDLTNRTMKCECGLTISRDQNAAINILHEGLCILSVSN